MTGKRIARAMAGVLLAWGLLGMVPAQAQTPQEPQGTYSTSGSDHNCGAFSFSGTSFASAFSALAGYTHACPYLASVSEDTCTGVTAVQARFNGNRIREEVKDPGGAIAHVTARTINHLNKVAAIQGATGQTTQIGYDANGEPISQTDPLNQTTRQTLDGLRRPTATTFADNTAAAQAWNQLDQLTQVTDPKGVATQYTYNAFGEVMSETSPDAGSIRYERDANGRVIQQTDARGQTTQITRDALGRPTQISRGADHQTIYTWDTQRQGYLAKVEDPSGSIAYQRDPQGRITVRTQHVNDNPANPASFVTRYGYQRGELATITYPSGLKVLYQRDATGQIVGIDTQAPGKTQTPFVSNLTHTALGQPKSWTWSNGGSANRTFDTDGRMVANEFASYIYDAASRITGITQHLWATSTATGVVTNYTTPLSWSVEYDNRNRITGFKREGAETRYTYDANSNRLTAIDKTTSDMDLDGDFDAADFQKTTSQNLNIGEGSNRLLGFTQTQTQVRGTRTISSANSNVAYTLDAAGNLTSDGLRTFEYDEANRMAKAKIFKDGEEATVRYLHNALGQRVFQGEPQASQTLPNQQTVGQGFIDWLKSNFGWMFQQQATTSIGTAFVYADGHLPGWAILGDYDNGSATGNGRSEYIWLPTGGGAIPVGLLRNGRFFAIHTDHLGTPRLMTNDVNKPVWQWPYSAFGTTKPTGILKATPRPKQAVTNQPVLLKATEPAQRFDLRYPGQMKDAETNTNQNIMRSYWPMHGAYPQMDPIGMNGGWNRRLYGEGNPLNYTDPMGLQSYMCAAGLSAWCPPPPKPPKPPAEGFNTNPCVRDYLKKYYGSFVADTMVPNFSGLSYVPGSGTAGQAWTSTAISAATKGGAVGAPYAFATAVEAMGAAGAGVAGGSTSSALMASGAYAGAFAGAASSGLAVFGAATLPFSSAANAMALLHCSCRK